MILNTNLVDPVVKDVVFDFDGDGAAVSECLKCVMPMPCKKSFVNKELSEAIKKEYEYAQKTGDYSKMIIIDSINKTDI